MSLLCYLAYSIVGYAGLVAFFYLLAPISSKAGFVARSLAAYAALQRAVGSDRIDTVPTTTPPTPAGAPK